MQACLAEPRADIDNEDLRITLQNLQEPASREDVGVLRMAEEPATAPREARSVCWMCKFHGNQVCDKAAMFVVDSIAHISFGEIIEQLHEHLTTKFPGEDIQKQQLSIHIREHMLHPRIKVARMLQRLSEMQNAITQNIVSTDAESEQTIIDASAVKLYNTLTSQILAVYKLDEEKLMFRNISMDK
jgi:hypothetical protein